MNKWYNSTVVKKLYLFTKMCPSYIKKKKLSFKTVCTVWPSLRYTKKKRTVQKTVDENVNTGCYLAGLVSYFPPLYGLSFYKEHILFL